MGKFVRARLTAGQVVVETQVVTLAATLAIANQISALKVTDQATAMAAVLFAAMAAVLVTAMAIVLAAVPDSAKILETTAPMLTAAELLS